MELDTALNDLEAADFAELVRKAVNFRKDLMLISHLQINHYSKYFASGHVIILKCKTLGLYLDKDKICFACLKMFYSVKNNCYIMYM